MSTTKPRFWSWELGRADYLITKAVLVAAPALYVAASLVPALLAWARGTPLTWASTVGEPDTAGATVQGLRAATGRFDGSMTWTIPDPSTLQRLLALVPGLEVAVLVTAGSVCLWRLLTRMRSGDPFGGPAVHYVRALAVLVLGYGLVVKQTRVFVDFLITAPIKPEPMALFTITPGAFVPIVLGVALLALAECFRQGARLRDEVDGLV
ncbi:MAG: DUF2975 domain-containing protein [Propionibacteriaceae bacterium]